MERGGSDEKQCISTQQNDSSLSRPRFKVFLSNNAHGFCMLFDWTQGNGDGDLTQSQTSLMWNSYMYYKIALAYNFFL